MRSFLTAHQYMKGHFVTVQCWGTINRPRPFSMALVVSVGRLYKSGAETTDSPIFSAGGYFGSLGV